MNYVVHDNNLDIFVRTISITLMSEGLMRLSQKKTCDPHLKGQMVVFCEYDSKPSIEKDAFHERVKIGEHYAYLINPGVKMTFNKQDYVMLSKPFLPCSVVSLNNMERYLSTLDDTTLERQIYNALQKDSAQGMSAQTLLKSLLPFTSEEFQSLLDDMHCELGDEINEPRDSSDLRRCLDVLEGVALTKKITAHVQSLSPLWNDIMANIKTLKKALDDKNSDFIKDFINQPRTGPETSSGI